MPIPARAHCVVTFSEGHNRQLRASLICGIIFFIVIQAWQGDSFFCNISIALGSNLLAMYRLSLSNCPLISKKVDGRHATVQI